MLSYKKYLIPYSIFLLLFSACTSSRYTTDLNKSDEKLIETGIASWYGPKFHGKITANGDIFNQYELTAAHRTLPFGSIIKVVNKSNRLSVIVKINDRGPFVKKRIIDLSRKAAESIDMIYSGFTEVDLILMNDSKLPHDLKTTHYTVQVGSFNRRTDALKYSSRIKNSRVVEATIDGQKYYRVYVGSFKNIDDAKVRNRYLRGKGIEGFVKQVEN